jgi:predicted solute-binding protein
MVEATVNPKYQRIKDYLMNMSKNNNISEEFVDRFVYNYINKDKWVSSEWIYQWFRLLGKTTRYNDFCDRYIKRLSSQYFKELPYSPTE